MGEGGRGGEDICRKGGRKKGISHDRPTEKELVTLIMKGKNFPFLTHWKEWGSIHDQK